MRVLLALLASLFLSVVAGCQGPPGPQGPIGTQGQQGPAGINGGPAPANMIWRLDIPVKRNIVENEVVLFTVPDDRWLIVTEIWHTAHGNWSFYQRTGTLDSVRLNTVIYSIYPSVDRPANRIFNPGLVFEPGSQIVAVSRVQNPPPAGRAINAQFWRGYYELAE